MNIHQFSCLLVLIFTCHFAAVSALVTPNTIKTMTIKMEVSTEAIRSSHTKYTDLDVDEEEDEDEKIEYTYMGSLIAGAVSEIVTFLKSELNVPMRSQPPLAKEYRNPSSIKCQNMREEFQSFIEASNKIINNFEKKKTTLNTAETNSIREQLKVLQALWSSRKANSQSLSFIEQQRILYRGTNCFKSIPNKFMIDNLDIVNRLNLLIDLYK